VSDDDPQITKREDTRLKFRMFVDGKPVGAVFMRPEKIAALLIYPQSFGECRRCVIPPRSPNCSATDASTRRKRKS
jgi:hypothetical protein